MCSETQSLKDLRIAPTSQPRRLCTRGKDERSSGAALECVLPGERSRGSVAGTEQGGAGGGHS